LSSQQQAALKQLLMGASITEAAQAAGVTRQTVSEWCNHHGGFQAELSECRSSALRDAQQQVEDAAIMGLVNGAAICRAGGVPLDVFMKFNEGTNSILLSEQKRLIEAIRDGRTDETEASIKAWREGNQALISVAASLGTDLSLQHAIQEAFQKGGRKGLDEHDISALVDVSGSRK